MRRKVTATYPRGDETRLRILTVAIRLFGLQGFDGVTTRMIAAEASVPAPSLRYYFENKLGLFVACWNHIQGELLEVMQPALVVAESLLAEGALDRMRLIDGFCGMQDALFEHMIAGPNAATTALFVMRMDLPTAGGGRKFPGGDGTVAYRMLNSFTQIIMRLCGDTLDWKNALIVAGLANAPLTTISAKRTGLANIGIEIADDRQIWLRRTIRQQTTSFLLMMSA